MSGQITFTGQITWSRPHADGTLIVLAHPEARLNVLLPHGTDPELTRGGARVTVTGDGDTPLLRAVTVKAA